ncbi:LysM peptidoglycan-binding domain-containing protein [Paludibacter jiangxiensis]|uniref:LysM domain-containing protein n=1 Tax=Paludibacter jiangxiensis TaxID=681398 RepID=A0A161LEC6_9BACT|nr:LysM peptidoglycan-binding domain-containing protein [Paludibacter jiangxiensis]GAT62925.1 LysM domain-containing protein [Paludibacter jiangxiensis]
MRYLVFLLLISINTVSLSAKGKSSNSVTLRDSLVHYAKTLINTPYRSGSKGPSGFDCSGYTSYVYGKFGMSLNSSSGSQVANGQEVDIDNLKKGDLVFFKGHNNKKSRIGHVGIFLDKNPDGSFNFIHSANGGGVRIDNSNSGYYAKRYVTGCTVIADKKLYKFDPVQVKSFSGFDDNVQYASTGKTHKVRKGESLYTIAQKYNVSEEQLKEWNNINGNKIKPGQKLSIQSEQKSSSKELASNTDKKHAKEQIASEGKTHTVKKGESFYTIAKKYHISEDDLIKANSNNGEKIKPGDKLQIPGGSASVKNESQESVATKTVTSRQTHKVKKGETLSEIAEKYHTTTAKIKRLNGLSGNKLKPGATLTVQEIEKEVPVKETKAETASKASKKETVNEEEQATKTATSRKTHKVRKGETLSEIADKFGVSVSQLKKWNGLSKNKVKPGTYLTVQLAEKDVPAKEAKAEAAPKASKKETVNEEEQATKTATSRKTYKVRKGDTLSGIADKFGVSVSQLKKWNGLSKNKVKPGTYLTVQMTEKEVPVKETKAETTSKASKKETVNEEEQATKTVTSRKSHKVRKGETLSRIADKFGVSVSQLKKWNGISKNKVKPGTYLTVQMTEKEVPVKEAKVTSETETSTVQKGNPSEKTHVVEKGETLYSIAKSHHISALKIKELNNLTDNQVHEGDVLSLDPNAPVTKAKEVVQNEPKTQQPEVAPAQKEDVKPVVLSAQPTEKIDTLTTSYKVNKTHVVQDGETLESIAELYQVTPAQIKSWNGISRKKNKVTPGQKLTIETVKKEYVVVSAKKKRPVTKGKTTKEAVAAEEPYSAPVVSTKPVKTSHTVSKGETLFTIAKETNLTVDQLKEYNHLNNTDVKENQVLSLIPDSTNVVKKAEIKTAITTKHIKYVVKPGDTLFSIAKAHNVSVDDLKAANEITSGEVNIGQQLQIPAR